MNLPPDFSFNQRTPRQTPILMGLVLLALGGCQTVGSTAFDSEPGPLMAPAPLPTLLGGDKFYYTSGLSYKITASRGDKLEWISSSKRKFTSTTNIFAPEILLETKSRNYTKTTQPAAHAIWPLSVGKETVFYTDIRYMFKISGAQKNYRQRWECSVDGTNRVRVLAGSFDTYRVACKRNSTTGRRKWRQTITYYYAPEIGHYVMRENRYRGRTATKRELTAVRPGMDLFSDEASRGIRRAFQDALENKKSGETSTYQDPKTNVAATVTPVQTFRSNSGKFCRNYRQTITQGSLKRTYAGVACREGERKWLTPKKVK